MKLKFMLDLAVHVIWCGKTAFPNGNVSPVGVWVQSIDEDVVTFDMFYGLTLAAKNRRAQARQKLEHWERFPHVGTNDFIDYHKRLPEQIGDWGCFGPIVETEVYNTFDACGTAVLQTFGEYNSKLCPGSPYPL